MLSNLKIHTDRTPKMWRLHPLLKYNKHYNLEGLRFVCEGTVMVVESGSGNNPDHDDLFTACLQLRRKGEVVLPGRVVVHIHPIVG